MVLFVLIFLNFEERKWVFVGMLIMLVCLHEELRIGITFCFLITVFLAVERNLKIAICKCLVFYKVLLYVDVVFYALSLIIKEDFT